MRGKYDEAKLVLIPSSIPDSSTMIGMHPMLTWRMESRMRDLLWEKARVFYTPGPNLVYISGDPDEIPNRNMINHFKHCIPTEMPFSYYYTQTMYRHNFAFVYNKWENGVVFGGYH